MEKGISDDKGGYYNNGVALIISDLDKIKTNDMQKGDLVTMWTSRTNHKGPNNGDYDHIVLITNVVKKNGKVFSFEYNDSGGSNSRVGPKNPGYVAGPRKNSTYIIGKSYSWRKITGTYRYFKDVDDVQEEESTKKVAEKDISTNEKQKNSAPSWARNTIIGAHIYIIFTGNDPAFSDDMNDRINNRNQYKYDY